MSLTTLSTRASVRASRAPYAGVALSAIAVLVASAPVFAQQAGQPQRGNPVRVNQAGNERIVAIDGGPTVRVTRNEVRSARAVAVPESDKAVVLWEEVTTDGSVQPHYAITTNNRQVKVAKPTSYDLKLKYRHFDPARESVNVPAALRAHDRTQLYIVQFVTQPLEEYRTTLRALGARVHGYIPEHAHLVKMSPEQRQKVAALPFVRWVGAYHPLYRLEQPLRDALFAQAEFGPSRYGIQVIDPDAGGKQRVARAITKLGGTVDRMDSAGSFMIATLDSDQLAAVARLDDVIYIDRSGEPVTTMNQARIIGGANYLETVAGFTGTDVRGEIMDNGCQTTHQDWVGRIQVRRAGTIESHGTATFGINFGDGTGSWDARGLLPDGNGVFAVWGTTGARVADTEQLAGPLWQSLYQSNSWHTTPATGAYNTASAELDEAVFKHDVVIVQAMGNSGDQSNAAREAWAKNVVSVGGIRHYNSINRNDHAWASSGSIGPAADGRIKPDLSNWYDYTRTTYPTNSYTSYFGGTSCATPITAGHFGLFYEMWAAGVFGNPVSGGTPYEERPHSSTARAFMINTAQQYPFVGTTHDLTRTHQGWGTTDVGYLYDRRDNLLYVDESVVLLPFESVSYDIYINAAQPYHDELRATLVYTDRWGTTSSSQHRINDLSLKVTSPSGDVYYGNYGLYAGNWSVAGGTPDTLNTVENVLIDNPENGIWEVEVWAEEINGDGHTETPALDADFALVVTGGVSWADCNNNGINDFEDISSGTSDDCNGDGIPDECEPDCNSNGIADECDILYGPSTDCDANGVPDECDPDCNANGIADACDIADGTSLDCNGNGIPDECDVAAGDDCDGNGVPDSCDVAGDVVPDCNTNGIPDSCDIDSGYSEDCNNDGVPDSCNMDEVLDELSPVYSPIGYEDPQSFVLHGALPATEDVTLWFAAYADLRYSSEKIYIDVNGTSVGEIFVNGYERCRDDPPQVDTLIVPMETWNDALAGGSLATINMVPSSSVASYPPTGCETDTHIQMSVSYTGIPTSVDCNTNGTPDECDIAVGLSTDVNGNGVPDECEDVLACLGDANCDGFVNFRDIDYFVAAQNDNVAAWEALFGGAPPCPFINNDVNLDGFVNFRDIDAFVALQNTTCP